MSEEILKRNSCILTTWKENNSSFKLVNNDYMSPIQVIDCLSGFKFNLCSPPGWWLRAQWGKPLNKAPLSPWWAQLNVRRVSVIIRNALSTPLQCQHWVSSSHNREHDGKWKWKTSPVALQIHWRGECSDWWPASLGRTLKPLIEMGNSCLLSEATKRRQCGDATPDFLLRLLII